MKVTCFESEQQENGVTFQVKKKKNVMSNVLLGCNYMAWELKGTQQLLPGRSSVCDILISHGSIV